MISWQSPAGTLGFQASAGGLLAVWRWSHGGLLVACCGRPSHPGRGGHPGGPGGLVPAVSLCVRFRSPARISCLFHACATINRRCPKAQYHRHHLLRSPALCFFGSSVLFSTDSTAWWFYANHIEDLSDVGPVKRKEYYLHVVRLRQWLARMVCDTPSGYQAALEASISMRRCQRRQLQDEAVLLGARPNNTQ